MGHVSSVAQGYSGLWGEVLPQAWLAFPGTVLVVLAYQASTELSLGKAVVWGLLPGVVDMCSGNMASRSQPAR